MNDLFDEELIPLYGYGKKRILIVGTPATNEEIQEKSNFLSKSSQYVKNIFDSFSEYSLLRDCFYYPAIISKEPKAIEENREYLKKVIKEKNINVVITLGLDALEVIIGEKESINKDSHKFYGFQIPDRDLNCWICPNYSPTDILMDQKNLSLYKRFRKYFLDGLNIYNRELPVLKKENVEIIYDIEKIKDLLFQLNGSYYAIDYETTGIKPQKKGHKIVCMGISTETHSYCFPVYNEVIPNIKIFLENNENKIIIQNMKFEMHWSYFFLNSEIKNIIWDTQIASHIIDNKTGITSLKFQTYVNFGIKGYEDEIKHLLTAENSYDFNKLKDVPYNSEEFYKVMYYCALDTRYTFDLYQKQYDIIINDSLLTKGMKFFMDGLHAFFDMERNGIEIDTELLNQYKKELTDKINELKKKILNSNENKLFIEKYNTDININSTKQLKDLFLLLNIKLDKVTEKGNVSIDDEVLQKINIDFTNNILELKRLTKLRDTFLHSYEIEISDNNKMHPSFNLYSVVTYRSSANNPNPQNIPSRNDLACMYTRKIIKTPKDYLILSADFKSVEVGVGCAYHQDTNMINYCKNPQSDMHRDLAAKLYKRDSKDITKNQRFIAKNKMVFASFYGSYYKQTAPDIWEELTLEDKKHLEQFNILDYNDFERHIQSVEKYLWSVMFPEYNSWKYKIWDFYQENQFVEYYTGFRCTDLMRKNQCTNKQIQGSAFHVLLWCCIELNNYFKKNNMKSYIFMQIHDALYIYVHKHEYDMVKGLLNEFMTVKAMNVFKWLKVPLSIEISESKIDGNLYEME